MAKLFGGWATDSRPNWKKQLEESPDYIIRQTGLSREELDRVLEVLYQERIIH